MIQDQFIRQPASQALLNTNVTEYSAAKKRAERERLISTLLSRVDRLEKVVDDLQLRVEELTK